MSGIFNALFSSRVSPLRCWLCRIEEALKFRTNVIKLAAFVPSFFGGQDRVEMATAATEGNKVYTGVLCDKQWSHSWSSNDTRKKYLNL